MRMNTANEINWDLIAEVDMSVRLNFFSDSNLVQAQEEMELLALDTLERDGSDLVLSSSEFHELQEPILAIIDAWGGSVDY
jgi:hypothetical protein